MPFAASIGEDRKRSPAAACSALLISGLWSELSWEIRACQCRHCPLRLIGQPSCSIDHLPIGDTSKLKVEIAEALAWMAEELPDWSELRMASREAEMAYELMGVKPDHPPGVIDDFMKQFAGIAPDAELWKDWNIYVEQFDGRPQRADVPEEMREEVDEIVSAITSKGTVSGDKLPLLMAASAVFWNAGYLLELETLRSTFGSLLEVSRSAIYANATLELS